MELLSKYNSDLDPTKVHMLSSYMVCELILKDLPSRRQKLGVNCRGTTVGLKKCFYPLLVV